MLSVVKLSLKEEVGGHALNSHGNYIADHGKSWNRVFEFFKGHGLVCDCDISWLYSSCFLRTNYSKIDVGCSVFLFLLEIPIYLCSVKPVLSGPSKRPKIGFQD